MLQSLRGATEIVAASLFAPDGDRLAEYRRDPRDSAPELDSQGTWWTTIQR